MRKTVPAGQRDQSAAALFTPLQLSVVPRGGVPAVFDMVGLGLGVGGGANALVFGLREGALVGEHGVMVPGGAAGKQGDGDKG